LRRIATNALACGGCRRVDLGLGRREYDEVAALKQKI
jgi:hypothetical protein